MEISLMVTADFIDLAIVLVGKGHTLLLLKRVDIYVEMKLIQSCSIIRPGNRARTFAVALK